MAESSPGLVHSFIFSCMIFQYPKHVDIILVTRTMQIYIIPGLESGVLTRNRSHHARLTHDR
jgi:hypothetical protein